MGKKTGAFENSKKAQGRARKADAEQAKADKLAAERAAAEDEDWKVGSKSDGKKEAAAAKKAEAARKKAERDALLAEEEAGLKSGKGTSKKEKEAAAAAAKKKPARGLQLDDIEGLGSPTSDRDGGESGTSGGGLAALNASGIDNALDALSLTSPSSRTVEKHPERRFKAAYAEFEERRLKEVKEDGSMDGLRLNQKKEKIRKEFERDASNPFNQTTADYNATKEEIKGILDDEAAGIESRLAERSP